MNEASYLDKTYDEELRKKAEEGVRFYSKIDVGSKSTNIIKICLIFFILF